MRSIAPYIALHIGPLCLCLPLSPGNAKAGLFLRHLGDIVVVFQFGMISPSVGRGVMVEAEEDRTGWAQGVSLV